MLYNKRNFIAVALIASIFGSSAAADCMLNFRSYVGWQILYVGNVTGYIDANGKLNNDFEGCEWDRVLVIDHNRTVTCTGYGYS